MSLFDSMDSSQLMRKIAYEPEVIVKGAKCTSQFEYKIDLEAWMFGTNAINSFYVFRMPIMKAASFSLITFAMPPDFYAKIDADLQQNLFPEIRVMFNLADLTKPIDNKSFEKLPAGITYTGRIIHALPRTHFTSQSKIVPVSLYIAQTVIHQMMLGNSFNKILNDITAYEALKKFEDGMQKRFGKPAISYDHLIVEKNKSKHAYENILMKSANDLTIPSVIHTTYKPLNNFSYYFFDDFDSSSKTPVIGRLRDLSEPLGEPWNIFEDEDKYDIARTLRTKGKVHIADRQEGFRPDFDKAATFIRNSKSEFKMNKNAEKIQVTQPSIQAEKGYIYDAKNARETTNNIAQLKETSSDSNRHASYYTPDDLSMAKVRNNNFYSFLKDLTDAVYKFEVYESHIDAIQFYRKYTLDQTDLKSYYVPINIVNVFSRINPHETPVSHTAQFQTIKYPSKEK